MATVTRGGVDGRTGGSESRGAAGWWIVGVAAIAVLAFVRTLGRGLYQDDYALARPWGFGEAVGVLWGEFDTSGFNDAYYRPFASMSFALEWPIYGTWTTGYHLTNLALHVVACIGVLLVLRRVRVPSWAAFAGAAYFAIIPANVATLVYIAERTDAMVAIGVTAALLCTHRYHRTRQTWPLVAISVCLVLAVLSKEIGVAVVPMIAVFWWYLRVQDLAPPGADAEGVGVVDHWKGELRTLWRALADRAGRRDWLLLLGPPLAVCVVYVAYRSAVMPAGSLGGRFAETQNPVSSLVGGLNSTFKGVPWEIRALAAVPLALAVVAALVTRPTSPTWRVVLLGVGLMVGGVLPLTFSGGVEPRLLYVAEIGMATVVAGVAAIVVDAVTARSGATRTAWAAVAGALGLVIVATTVVSMLDAQDVFAPGSPKRLDGALRVWEDDASRPYVAPEHLADIERELRAAGRIP